jgi:hypothetical protein
MLTFEFELVALGVLHRAFSVHTQSVPRGPTHTLGEHQLVLAAQRFQHMLARIEMQPVRARLRRTIKPTCAADGAPPGCRRATHTHTEAQRTRSPRRYVDDTFRKRFPQREGSDLKHDFQCIASSPPY